MCSKMVFVVCNTKKPTLPRKKDFSRRRRHKIVSNNFIPLALIEGTHSSSVVVVFAISSGGRARRKNTKKKTFSFVNASRYHRKNVVPLRAVPRFCQDGFVGLFVRTVDGREAKIDARID